MDLRIALQSRGVQVIQSPTDHNEIRFNCLFCVERGYTQDFKQRLGINVVKNYGNCFNCGWKSRKAVSIIAKKLSLGEIDARFQEDQTEPEKVKLPEDFELLAGRLDSKWKRKAFNYLRDRNVTRSQMVKHKIGFSLSGRFRYRIIFPVYVPYEGLKGKKNKLEGIVARSFVNKEPRYLNSRGIKSVYNLPDESVRYAYRVGKGLKQILVISEGILKCLAIERALPVNSIALLGHTMTERQEDLIGPDRWDEIVLFPDPDIQGARGFIKVGERLSLKAGNDDLSMKLSVVWPIPKKQADEMTVEEIKSCFRNREPYTENFVTRWKFQSIKSK